MLHKDRITNLKTAQYDILGLLSSRRADLYLLGKNGLGKQALDYIANKACETITGVYSDRIFGFVENYDWQINVEPEALTRFCETKPDNQFMIHFPIITDGGIFIAEPSGLWLRGINQRNPDEYIVEPLICKCPKDFNKFVRYTDANSPAQLKAVDYASYWRVLDNMLLCEATTAYFFVYHPLFDSGTNHHTVQFERIEVLADLNLLKERKKMAEAEYRRVIEKMSYKD